MSPLDQKILSKIANLIEKYVGKNNPIQVDELVEKTKFSDREVRRAVQILVNDWGYPIGSTTKGPYGFYMISNEEDFIEAIGNLTGRNNEIAKRIKKLFENCKSKGVKINSFKKKLDSRNITINIKNLFFINYSNEGN